MLHLSKVDRRLLSHLAASDDVVGTKVRRPSGQTLGEIARVMLDKKSGRVAYVVMRFGGLFGIGSDECALPWDSLIYSQRLHAYEVDLTAEGLRNAAQAFRRAKARSLA